MAWVFDTNTLCCSTFPHQVWLTKGFWLYMTFIHWVDYASRPFEWTTWCHYEYYHKRSLGRVDWTEYEDQDFSPQTQIWKENVNDDTLIPDDMGSVHAVCDMTGHVNVEQKYSLKSVQKIQFLFQLLLCTCSISRRSGPYSGTVPEQVVCHILRLLNLHFCSIDMCSQISTWSADLVRDCIVISITHKVQSLSIQR